MEIILFASLAISFILTAFILPRWINKCKVTNLLWEDMNKWNHPKNVASSGGVVVITSFILGVLSYVAIRTFFFKPDGTNLSIFALISMILLLAIVGLTDDLLGWKHGGLSVKFRLFFAFAASLPLVVINAGTPRIVIPFLGEFSLGLIYPLVLIPIGIAGATTTYNMLAGFNGLETGLGIIILSFLSYIAYATGSSWLSIVGLCMVAALIAFYYWNRYPARVFPGDIMTYSIGALIAGMCILGNFERIAILVFIPFIIETFLKSRGRLKKPSFGIPQKDRSLEMPYKKIYGLTHFSIWFLKKLKKKVYEQDVTRFIFAIQIIICLITLLLFWLELV